MKIGILGGTFDPVHLGHLNLAKNARDQFSLDKVIFIPAYRSPDKQHAPFRTSAADRYEMVRLAIENEPCFAISDLEIVRKGVSYSFDTVCELERQYPGATLFWILGKDAFQGLDLWYRAAELKKKVRFLVAKRGDEEYFQAKNAQAEWLEMPLCPVASTAIREAIGQGLGIEKFVPSKVVDFIHHRHLYQKAEMR